MRVIVVGFNREVVAALCASTAEHEVWVLEEPDLWRDKGLAAVAAAQPRLAGVVLTTYQQSVGYRDVIQDLPPLDAVLPGLEYAVPAAADIAERLGLPGAGTHAATILCDKIRLRDATARTGMVAPEFRQVASAADVARFLEGGAAVLKPAQRQASLGVQLLQPDADVQVAWAATTGADEGVQVARRALTWRYLVERRLVGTEHSTEALVARGEVLFVNVTCQETLPGPHPVKTGHTLPTRDDGRWRRAVEDLVAAVGFGSGMVHAEWMDTSEGPVLIECAGRPPGDRLVDLIDHAWDFSLLEAWVSTLAGVDSPSVGSPVRCSAIQFLTADPGLVSEVHGTDAARATPGVREVRVDATAEARVREVRSAWDRVGWVIASGGSPADARARAREGAAMITVTTRGTS